MNEAPISYKYSRLIRVALTIIGIYLLFDSGIHLFALRFKDVTEIWPADALAFSKFLSQIYGSFTLLAALIILELSRKVEQYRNLIFITGIWAFLHGILLFYLSAGGFFSNFGKYSSLYFYTGPFYKAVVFAEALFLIIFSALAVFFRVSFKKS